ncbi:MerR family transcriptional regulator [Clostridium sp. DJ247]|uniref:MerR family transcriptional regulator n=1 Tax=Clostridium sp. DJ247 TaxID=2726188 RepID=UPI001628EAEA|nr:MerR family transcriptional regulator [Clostridium sp. DJ247]MBC2582267.1 MerR family transcriptional regulator [Clostridium sp. DJ247]
MNIKVASEKTGLTKRAIKYYEDEGLIHPLKNCDNNYREYSERDIVKLNLIGALRAVDIPMFEIKNVIEGKKSIPDVMKDTLQRINESMDKLEKSKLVITNIIEKNLDDYDTAGECIKKLRETLELSMDEKKELISTILLRKFPGKFGEVFVAMYEPFLKITIDTEEKKSAWLKLVELLDGMDEIDENSYFVKWYDKAEIGDMKNYKESTSNTIEKILSKDVSKEDIEKNSMHFIKSLKESESRDRFNEMLTLVKEQINVIGPIQKQFGEYLSILNEDYKRYMENFKRMAMEMNKEVINQSGLGIEELMKKSNITAKD